MTRVISALVVVFISASIAVAADRREEVRAKHHAVLNAIDTIFFNTDYTKVKAIVASGCTYTYRPAEAKGEAGDFIQMLEKKFTTPDKPRYQPPQSAREMPTMVMFDRGYIAQARTVLPSDAWSMESLEEKLGSGVGVLVRFAGSTTVDYLVLMKNIDGDWRITAMAEFHAAKASR